MELEDDDELLRRVLFLNPDFVRPDGSLTSAAFKISKNEDGLSVNVKRLTTYDAAVLDSQKYRLYAVTLSFVRSLELDCVPDPLPDNPANALIKGEALKDKTKIRLLAAEASKNPVSHPPNPPF